MGEDSNKIEQFFNALETIRNSKNFETPTNNMFDNVKKRVLILFFGTKENANCYMVNVNDFFNHYPCEINEKYFLSFCHRIYPNNNLQVINNLTEKEINFILKIFIEKYAVNDSLNNKSNDTTYWTLIGKKSNNIELYFPSSVLSNGLYGSFKRFLESRMDEFDSLSNNLVYKRADTNYNKYYEVLVKDLQNRKEVQFKNIDLFFNMYIEKLITKVDDTSALIFGNQETATAYFIGCKSYREAGDNHEKMLKAGETYFLNNYSTAYSDKNIVKLTGLSEREIKYISLIFLMKYSAQWSYWYNESNIRLKKDIGIINLDGRTQYGSNYSLFKHIFINNGVISLETYNEIKDFYNNDAKYTDKIVERNIQTPPADYYEALIRGEEPYIEYEKQKIKSARTYFDKDNSLIEYYKTKE
jgi:hypothetical protein